MDMHEFLMTIHKEQQEIADVDLRSAQGSHQKCKENGTYTPLAQEYGQQ